MIHFFPWPSQISISFSASTRVDCFSLLMRVSVMIAWGLLNDDSMTLLGFEMLSQTLISVVFF